MGVEWGASREHKGPCPAAACPPSFPAPSPRDLSPPESSRGRANRASLQRLEGALRTRPRALPLGWPARTDAKWGPAGGGWEGLGDQDQPEMRQARASSAPSALPLGSQRDQGSERARPGPRSQDPLARTGRGGGRLSSTAGRICQGDVGRSSWGRFSPVKLRLTLSRPLTSGVGSNLEEP